MHGRDCLRFFVVASSTLLLVACGGGTSTSGTPRDPTPSPAAALGLENERAPARGLTTGAVPTVNVLQAAKERGYRTVVSLLIEGEPGLENVARASEARGMRFVHIPVEGIDGLTEENARQLGEILNDDEARPVLLHCSSGNRSGALLALKAFYVDGASVDDALELGRAAGLERLEEATRDHLERAAAAR